MSVKEELAKLEENKINLALTVDKYTKLYNSLDKSLITNEEFGGTITTTVNNFSIDIEELAFETIQIIKDAILKDLSDNIKYENKMLAQTIERIEELNAIPAVAETYGKAIEIDCPHCNHSSEIAGSEFNNNKDHKYECSMCGNVFVLNEKGYDLLSNKAEQLVKELEEVLTAMMFTTEDCADALTIVEKLKKVI